MIWLSPPIFMFPTTATNTIRKAALSSPVEGRAITNKTVFDFTDANLYATASAFSATVNTSAGALIITANPSNVPSLGDGFDVKLSCTYPDSHNNQNF